MDRVTCRESCKRHTAVSGKVRRGKRGFSAMANDIYTRARFQLLCGFAVPELLKSALVLVLLVLPVLLVVLVVLVLLLLVVFVFVFVVVATHLFSHFCGPQKKLSRRWCFRIF